MARHDIIYFQRRNPETLEIYQMATSRPPWNIGGVVAKPDKKTEAEKSAREIAARLEAMGLPKGIDSERQWTIDAGVSSSFFSNLRKSPSDPTVNNLRLILRTRGSSLPEFFLHEAEGRLMSNPPEEALVGAIRDSLAGRQPKGQEARARRLAVNLRRLLGLPPGPPTTPGQPAADAPETGGSIPLATTGETRALRRRRERK